VDGHEIVLPAEGSRRGCRRGQVEVGDIEGRVEILEDLGENDAVCEIGQLFSFMPIREAIVDLLR